MQRSPNIANTRRRGRSLPPEHCRRISEAKKGIKPAACATNVGRKNSEETLKKMSESARRRFEVRA